MAHGTVWPLGLVALYWGRSDLPSVGPIRLRGQFAEVAVRGRYAGICWR